MFFDLGFIGIGLFVLVVAGDALVRGAVGLAQKLRISPLIIGLTIVAFGTSAPELIVAIRAVLAGSPEIALGNIIGSNSANVCAVLAPAALIFPISARSVGMRRNTLMLLAAMAGFLAIAYSALAVGFDAGLALLGGLALYLGYLSFKAIFGDETAEEIFEIENGPKRALTSLILVIVGLGGLPLGAALLVDHAQSLALSMGVREELVGLTIIALGTSLPELGVAISAALHRQSDVALGNILGSNIFNILAVGGAIGLVGGAGFSNEMLAVDLPFMAATSIALAALIFLGREVSRPWASAFILAYCGYFVLLALESGLV